MSIEQSGDLPASLFQNEAGSIKNISSAKTLFTLLWSGVLTVFSSDKSPELPASVLGDITNVGHINIFSEDIIQNFNNKYISSTEETYQFSFWNIMLLKQLLVNLSVRLTRAGEIHKQKNESFNFQHRKVLNIHIGLLCKETEQIKFPVTKALKALADMLEENDFVPVEETLIVSLSTLIDAIWYAKEDNDKDIQIFYADQLYDALDKTYEKLGLSLNQHWITPYTWLYGDKDGRPFEKNSDTESLVKSLRGRIIERYKNELTSIYYKEGSYVHEEINSITRKLSIISEGYETPDELVTDLQNIKGISGNSHLIDILIMKIRTFGFFYMEIEFRDNEEMISSVVNEIIPDHLITEKFPARKKYSDLNEDERIEILSFFISQSDSHSPDKIKSHYLSRTARDYDCKTEKYKEKDYISLMEIDENYIRMYDARNVLSRFSLMAEYPDMMKTHGIAEASYISSVFELLFLSKTERKLKSINIAIQPEDSQGAIDTLDKIKKLYSNNIYRRHLSSLNDTQFITFGPSDTGKQGGKGMHKLNMMLAREHELIAREYGIKLVRHVIVGGEHARCNGDFKEVFHEYGASNDEQTRFMLAGCAEMRSHLLSKHQAINFFCEIYNMQIEENKHQEHFAELKTAQGIWKKVVDRYQDNFFNSPSMPNFLKNVARFDVVRGTSKGTRPPSRIYNITDFESRPDAIRAIPWTRSILLSGLHSELIGVGAFAEFSNYKIVQKYKNDISFRNYIKNIAYAAARTNDEFIWLTSGLEKPDSDEIKKRAVIFEEGDKYSTFDQLCWISHEITLAKDLVWRAIYGYSHSAPECLSAKDLLTSWETLCEEVLWKEQMLIPYRLILLITRQDKLFLSSKALSGFYSGFLESANTGYSMIYS
jgi:phosphoenolpyruvate carboxylase